MFLPWPSTDLPLPSYYAYRTSAHASYKAAVHEQFADDGPAAWYAVRDRLQHIAEFDIWGPVADDGFREIEHGIFRMWLPSPSMWAWVIRQFTTG